MLTHITTTSLPVCWGIVLITSMFRGVGSLILTPQSPLHRPLFPTPLSPSIPRQRSKYGFINCGSLDGHTISHHFNDSHRRFRRLPPRLPPPLPLPTLRWRVGGWSSYEPSVLTIGLFSRSTELRRLPRLCSRMILHCRRWLPHWL